jgi:Domain of unknown function (DUF4184)
VGSAGPAYPFQVPLSPAHPAAVLPLQRLGLPLSALVIGSLAPDLPVYLPVGVDYQTTHSGWGISVDVVIGLALMWLWFTLLRDAVVDLTPSLRTRAPARVRLDRRAWLLAPLALAIGAATHVLWDSATHDWGFIVEELPLLREQYGPMRGYQWLQQLSTAAGSIAVAAYCVHQMKKKAVVDRSPAVQHSGLWLVPVALSALAVGLASRDLEAAVGAGLVALVVVAIGWRVARQPSRAVVADDR